MRRGSFDEKRLRTLYPGVRGAGVRLRPVRRPSRARVKVHIVGGGFQPMGLSAVVGRGRVGDDFVQVRVVVVAVGELRVHPVRIIVPPAQLVCIIHRLQEEGEKKSAVVSVQC